MTAHSRETLHFGDFALDVADYQLRRHGCPVRLERQPMDLLILLVQRRGQLLSRSEIVECLWGKDVFVDVDTGVHTAIRKIRQALRDSPGAPVFVETVSGKGYRFIAQVDVVPGSPDALAAQEPASALALTSSHPLVIAASDAPAAAAMPVVAGAEFASSEAFAQRRRARLVAVVVGVAALAGILTWGWQRVRSPPPRLTLAVLPFENLSGDPDRDYLADGLAEETIVSLGQIDPDRVQVVGRTSMMVYKRTTKSLAEIGRELGADYLVESSVRAEGGELRVTAKLIRVRDQVQSYNNDEPAAFAAAQRAV